MRMTSDQPETMTIRIKGVSHYQDAASHCRIGDVVNLIAEPNNSYDRNAVRVDCHQRCVGYIARELARRIQPLAQQGHITAIVSDVLGEKRSDFNLGIELKLTIHSQTEVGSSR